MQTAVNIAAFEAWLRTTGRKWYHLNTEEKKAAVKEYKGQSK